MDLASSMQQSEPNGQAVLHGLSPEESREWANHVGRFGMAASSATTVRECEVLARSAWPSVVVTTQEMFDSRMVHLSDEAFRRTTLIVLSHDPRSIGFWRLVAWEAAPQNATYEQAASVLESAREEALRRHADCEMVDDYHARLNKLSPEERSVFEAVCAGRLNKQIANDLKVSVRTVEQRRRRVFDKMGVESAVPLSALRATVRTLENQWARLSHQIDGVLDTKPMAPPVAPPRPESGVGATWVGSHGQTPMVPVLG